MLAPEALAVFKRSSAGGACLLQAPEALGPLGPNWTYKFGPLGPNSTFEAEKGEKGEKGEMGESMLKVQNCDGF